MKAAAPPPTGRGRDLGRVLKGACAPEEAAGLWERGCLAVMDGTAGAGLLRWLFN